MHFFRQRSFLGTMCLKNFIMECRCLNRDWDDLNNKQINEIFILENVYAQDFVDT